MAAGITADTALSRWPMIKLTWDEQKIFDKLLKKLENVLQEMPKEMAVLTLAEMDTQLDSGRGLDKPLKPYDPDYKLLREGAGRGSTPNLTLTSQMRNSAQVVERGKTAEVVFVGSTSNDAYKRLLRKSEKGLKSGLGGDKPLQNKFLSFANTVVKAGGEIANASKAYYTNLTRPWIGLGQDGVNKVANLLGAKLIKKLNK